MKASIYRATCYLGQRHAMKVLFVLVGLLHVLVNLQFSGPTYTADEIGYLYNALTLAGAKIEGASSYHLGYALFLAPVFALQFGDWGTWFTIVLVNTAFVLGTLYCTNATLREVVTDQHNRLWAIGLCGIYPAAVAFSGYAFAQPAISFFFALACYSLIKPGNNNIRDLAIFGSAIGFLYWIHPTAIALAIAATLSLAIRSYARRTELVPAAVAIALMVGLILLHKLVAHPALVDAMTTQNATSQLHYPDMAGVFSQIANIDAFTRIIIRISGQFLYLTLATLGLFAVGLCVMFRQFRENHSAGKPTNDKQNSLYAFIVLSLLGVAAMSAMMFEALKADWASHFFYGRYLETMVFLPFAIGVMTWPARTSHIRNLSAIALALFAVAVLLVSIHDKVDWINVQGFWQLGVSNYNVPLAFLMAAATLYAMNFLERPMQLRIIAALFALGIFKAQAYHHGEWLGRSAPSELPKLVSDAYPDATCIAYDPGRSKAPWRPTEDSKQHTRNLLERRVRAYGYYLRNYEFRRMTIAEWRKSCDGPFLTSDRSLLTDTHTIVAVEEMSGIMVIGRQPFRSTGSYRGVVVASPKKSAHITPSPSG